MLGSRLAAATKEALKLENIEEFYWSDSTTAIAWIQGNDEWGTFVGNRVKEIRSQTGQDVWRHVPGILNPADLPSRGCSPTKLLQLKWWEGPSWLKEDPHHWPQCKEEVDWSTVNEERRKTTVKVMTVVSRPDPWYGSYSSYQKTISVIAWTRRFINNARASAKKGRNSSSPRFLKPISDVPPLEVEDYEEAEVELLKSVQEEAFEKDVNVIKGLQVVKDLKGLYRVETKITMGAEPYDFRYPIIMPSHHPVVDMIILEDHKLNSHAGIQALQSRLRERFWIISSRKTIRRVLGSCVRCKRYDVKKIEASPAPLPLDRIRNCKVFEVAGVDLAGPFYVREKEDVQKVWLVLYTCAVYRAVHLELVKSLSTDAFLLSFRRIIARRGRPSIVYSDNGTNFVGVVGAMNELDWNSINKFCALQRIKWRFNPPTASWWGGWWERLIGMTKKLLLRTLGRASLSYDELLTVTCDVEAVINSRPLTYVSENNEDLIPLSPSMFLQEIQEVGVPDLDELDAKGFEKRFRYRQQLRNELRGRFRQEYLGQLVQKVKENQKTAKLSPGDVVLIGADNKKRYDWPMGKIVELLPGRDGKIRLARVKVKGNQILRPVQRLYPLEVGQSKLPDEDVAITKSKEKEPEEPFKPKESTVQVEVRTRRGRLVKKPDRF